MSQKQNNLEEKVKEVKGEVIDAQKTAVIREIATYELHLDFTEIEYATKKKKDVDKEVLKSLAEQRKQQILPLKDKLEGSKKYYAYLCEQE